MAKTVQLVRRDAPNTLRLFSGGVVLIAADGAEATHQRLAAVMEDTANFAGVIAVEVPGASDSGVIRRAESVAVDGGVDVNRLELHIASLCLRDAAGEGFFTKISREIGNSV